jgi:hypothetical protein
MLAILHRQAPPGHDWKIESISAYANHLEIGTKPAAFVNMD